MSFISKVSLQLSEALKPKVKSNIYMSGSGAISETEKLYPAFEGKHKTWVPFGCDDNTPDILDELALNSAIHGAILKTRSLMVSGQGILINGAKTPEQSLINYNKLTSVQKSELKFLDENKYGGIERQEAYNQIADNDSITGGFAYIVKWNTDFTKIASYMPVRIRDLRPAIPNEKGEIEKYYYYCGDWSKARDKDLKEYFVYNRKDKEHYDQIVYEKDGTHLFFPVAAYKGAITWVKVDIEMATFHHRNIMNGMNPGMHFKFYHQPESDEEKAEVVRQVKSQFMGPLKAGEAAITFSNDKELATEVVPIEVSNIDKQLLNLTEMTDRKILSGHQLTSPLLAGISVSGQIGGNVELPTAFELYNNMICAKRRQRIDNSFQKHIYDINVPGVKLNINPFNPLANLTTNV